MDYDRSKIKMVGIKVERRSDGSCYATQTYAKAHTFSSSAATEYEYDFDDATHTNRGQCRNAACSASKYPLGPIAQGSPDLAGLGATRLEYVTLSFGDAPPDNKFLNLNNRFLPDTSGGRVVHTYGDNEDLDARRIIPKNAALCGGAIQTIDVGLTTSARDLVPSRSQAMPNVSLNPVPRTVNVVPPNVPIAISGQTLVSVSGASYAKRACVL